MCHALPQYSDLKKVCQRCLTGQAKNLTQNDSQLLAIAKWSSHAEEIKKKKKEGGIECCPQVSPWPNWLMYLYDWCKQSTSFNFIPLLPRTFFQTAGDCYICRAVTWLHVLWIAWLLVSLGGSNLSHWTALTICPISQLELVYRLALASLLIYSRQSLIR